MMLKAQLEASTMIAGLLARMRGSVADERGEITSTVAIIGVLVVGALAAGAIVVTRMKAHATAIPSP